MPVPVDKKLFEDAKNYLKNAIEQYEENHPIEKMVEEEKQGIKDLKSIQEKLNSATNLTDDSYKHIISDINIIKLPKNGTIKITTGTGKNISTSSKTIPIALNYIIQSIYRKLEALLTDHLEEQIKKQVNNGEIENLKKQMQDFNSRLKEQELDSKNRELIAYKKGADDFKLELLERMRLLPENMQMPFLKLLTGDNSTPNIFNNSDNKPEDKNKFPFFANSNTIPKSDTTQITGLERDKQKAREWIGELKFLLIEKLVEFSNTLPSTEELRKSLKQENNESLTKKIANRHLIRFLIFQLMLHKYDETIATIISKTTQYLAQEKITLDKTFPQIAEVLENQDKSNEQVSDKKLNFNELETFYQLVGNTAIYLETDGTAANYFGSLSAAIKDPNTSIKITTEQQYIDNFIKKISTLKLAAIQDNTLSEFNRISQKYVKK